MQSFPDRVSDLARTVPVGRPVGQDRGALSARRRRPSGAMYSAPGFDSGSDLSFRAAVPGRLSVPHVSGRPFGVHSGVQPLRVRLQVPNGSVPLGCIRPFLAVAARPCRLFARQPGGFVVPCGSDLRLPDRRVTGCQGCRSAGTNPDAKIAKKFYRTFPPEHSRPGISVRASCPSIPVRVSLSARSCPVCRRLRSIRLSVRSTLSPLFPVRITAPVPPFALPLSESSGPKRLCPSSDSSFVVSSGSPHRFFHLRCLVRILRPAGKRPIRAPWRPFRSGGAILTPGNLAVPQKVVKFVQINHSEHDGTRFTTRPAAPYLQFLPRRIPLDDPRPDAVGHYPD